MSDIPEKEEKYYEAHLTIQSDMQEPVSNFIIENLASGIVLEEEEDSSEVVVRFYVPQSDGLIFRERLAKFISTLGTGTDFSTEDIQIKSIANIEWEQAYKDSIKPIQVENVVIKPPWEIKKFDSGIEIIIEPKMAFGTGSHETTQLCIKEILKYFRPGGTFFDLGCGSGILSILAAKLGASAVRGVDIDVVAVENSEENIVLNKVDDKVKILFGSIERAKDATYDFLAGNLIRSAIVDLMPRMLSAVTPGGILLLSGLLEQDRQAISELFDRHRITKFEINQDGQWLAYTIFV